ncbi:hypothetical protein BDV59DRAFT_199936 [Aspergillus ambiguus]|uniref:uncharacterized protein n=1 Tax=Aspergillus ambiguus TaxID=176160 RepID=UPI003CCDA513
MAPATGIMLSDYHVVQRYKLKLEDLYTGDTSSTYWYWHGVNWRAFVTFIAAMWPLLPGLVATVNSYNGKQWTGWTRLYNLTFLVGLAMSFLIFWGLNRSFPAVGLGQDEQMIEGETIEGRTSSSAGKDVITASGGKKQATANVV